MKLHGLSLYLSKQLDLDIKTVENFSLFDGPEVLSAPAFTDNAGTFGVSYGLALQALGKSPLRTNLLPKEIVRDRLIKKKKPWAVAAAATLLLGCGISIGANAYSNESVAPADWQSAETAAQGVNQQSGSLMGQKDEAVKKYEELKAKGDRLVGNVEGRLKWLELTSAISECLPRENDGEVPPLSKQRSLRITNVEAQKVPLLEEWYTGICALKGEQAPAPTSEDGSDAPPPEPADGAAADGPPMAPPGPSGEGWVVRVEGFHYHNDTNDPRLTQGAEYVREEFLNKLNDPNYEVTLTGVDISQDRKVTLGDLGIGHAHIILPGEPQEIEVESAIAQTSDEDDRSSGAGVVERSMVKVERFDFTIHFAWQPNLPTDREQIAAERLAAEQAAAEAAAAETPEE